MLGTFAGKLKRFLSSPYFKIIPTTHELEALKASKGEASEASEDYLASIKRLTLDTLDTDGVYGLTEDELVPLPFQAPVVRVHASKRRGACICSRCCDRHRSTLSTSTASCSETAGLLQAELCMRPAGLPAYSLMHQRVPTHSVALCGAVGACPEPLRLPMRAHACVHVHDVQLKDYLIEILAGVYSVAQACVVMFLAINVSGCASGRAGALCTILHACVHF